MAVCAEGQKYVNAARKNLNEFSHQVVEQIRLYLYNSADFAGDSVSIEMHFKGSGRSLQVDSENRIVELEEEDLLELENYRFPPGTLKGIYNPRYRKIFLNKKMWCVETLFHEMLHSMSITAHEDRAYMQFSSFFEGLTELYSGYTMRKIFPESYSKCWRYGKNSACYCTYQREVKILLGLYHFIPFEYTYNLYFLVDNRNWVEKWYEFIKRIRDYGYPRFDNVIDDDRKPKWLSLHQECAKNFGKEYLKIYNDLKNPLNLDLLKTT
jgi:hypothetical protein